MEGILYNKNVLKGETEGNNLLGYNVSIGNAAYLVEVPIHM